MDTLALDLLPSEQRRLQQLHANGPLFSFARPADTTQKHYRPRRRRLSVESIRLAVDLLDKGVPKQQICDQCGIGKETILEIAAGRYTDQGRLPPELEIGERYCKPHNCPHGHYIRIEPCRTCKAIAKWKRSQNDQGEDRGNDA